MAIKDVVAQLDVVLTKIDATRTLLTTAATLLDEATEIIAAAVAGTASIAALQVLALFGEAQQGVQAPLSALQAVEKAVRVCRAHMVGDADSRGHRPQASPVPPAAPVTASPERIEQLRRELPPSVTSSLGQKTHGRWIDSQGNVHHEVSGKDEKSEHAVRFFEEEIKSRRIPVTVVDVEIKLAVHMRKNGIRSAVLVLNNFPCRGPMGCNTLVPVVLPPGYTMTVYGPNGFRQEYEGGATSKWVP